MSVGKILGNAWAIISQPNDKNSQVALAIGTIVVTALIGALASFLYGVTARGDGWANRIAGGFVAVLACVGAFSAGGMLGLLFGSPTFGNQTAAAVVASASTGSTGATQNGKSAQMGVRPNTSLERVADWLTTMIVGLGLVNLGSIKSEATSLSVWLTQAITGANSANGTPGASIALGFSFAGFLLVYLWSLRFLPSELRDSYGDLQREVQHLARSNETVLAEFKKMAAFVVPQSKLEQLKKRLTESNVEGSVCDEIEERYRPARGADDEPMENFGPISSDGYALEAKVSDLGGRYEIVVELAVSPSNAATKVFWLLHNSFTPEVMSECPIEAGKKTSFKSIVDEAFWIAAIIPPPAPGGKSVKLAYSLYDIPGAPHGFRGR